jgi:nucleotide-binding universal stress UspA family protein
VAPVYTKLIVPLDSSETAEAALAPTAALASQLGVPVELVLVSSPGIDAVDDDRYLEKAAASLACTVGTVRRVGSNDVVGVLVDIADEPGALLCMSTRGRSRLAPVLGSIAAGVVRSARHPVLLFGPEARPPAAFDVVAGCIEPGSDRSHAVLAPALAMSMELDATFWLVEVRQRDWIVSDTPGAVDGGEVAALTHELRRGGNGVEWCVRHEDHAASGILAAAGDLEPALIVMASRARAGVARLALGSVTTDVVRRAACGVLVVPPLAVA